MIPDRTTLCLEARALPPGPQRQAYLDAACAGDPALRQAVEAMLQEGPGTDADFAGQATIVDQSRRVKEEPGTCIGPYKLLQEIGEGGFGTVWMAEQQQPVRRRVALKIIKAGMNTREVVARFEQERQALAMMDHPHIARVFDAGCTETGRPYFVMELVKGIPVTKFCDEQKLGSRERLVIFADVCAAINHAHQKGIIHRDIKPTNVMVTLHADKPVAKVIDFGIAKATQERLTDKTLFTRFEQFIGTPAYMSPEQAALSGLDIDTRSDIYSLGVLLYELLTGRPPFDPATLASAGYDEMRRIIREVEPPRPSARLHTTIGEERTAIASARHTTADKISRLVATDLDWIVMKALEKDRTRRYETANAFALDIQRFLADEPVSATPPGAGYLLRKFARRHRRVLRVAAVFVLLLVAGTVVSTLLAIRATTAEREVTRQLDLVKMERDQKKDLVRFVTEMLASPDPAHSDRNITVLQVLDRAGQHLGTSLANQPARQAGVRSVIGGSYSALGLWEQAIPLQEQALEFYLHSPDFGPEHGDTIQAQTALAFTYDLGSKRKEAIILLRNVLAWQQGHRPPGHPEISSTMSLLGRVLHFDGQVEEGRRLLEQALQLSRIDPGPKSPQTLPMMHWLAVSYHAGRNPALEEEARHLDDELAQISTEVLGGKHPDTIRAETGALGNITDPVERARREKDVESLSAEVNGPENPLTLALAAKRASSLRASGQREEALRLLENLFPRMVKANGEGHADTLWVMSDLASALEKTGREEDRKRALQMHRDGARLSSEGLGELNFNTLGRRAKYACALFDNGDTGEALHEREKILPLLERNEALGPDHETTDWVRRDLTRDYLLVQKDAEAIPLMEKTLELRRAAVREGRARLLTGDPKASELEAKLREDESKLRETAGKLALSYSKAGRAADAARMQKELDAPPAGK